VLDFTDDGTTSHLTASSTLESLDYEEPSVTLTLNQLLSEEWSLGARYRFTRSELHRAWPLVDTSVFQPGDPAVRSDLHEALVQVLYNHRKGFFSRAEAEWLSQENAGYDPARPGDSFPQLNLYAGWRLQRQRGDVTLGLLNITDEDYRLNPLTPYLDRPRQRTLYARLRFNF
jgi:hypothetical protein